MGSSTSSVQEKYDPSVEVIKRAPGIGAYGLSPINPIVIVQRGHGPRGGGENKSIHRLRSTDIRGESPVILNRIKQGEGTASFRGELPNDRLEAEKEDQFRDLYLRYQRRITS